MPDVVLYVWLFDLVLAWAAIRVKRRRVREELADEVAAALGEDQLGEDQLAGFREAVKRWTEG